MEPNKFAKVLPKLCKYFIFFDMRKNQYNDHLFFSRLMVNIYFLYTTLSCIGDTETQPQIVSKFHDSVYLLTLISNEICFYTNKGRLFKVLRYVLEKVEDYEKDSKNARITQNYRKGRALYCKIVVFGCVGGTALYYMMATVYFYLLVEERQGCIHLPMGWMRYSESYTYFMILNAVAAHNILASSFVWFLVMYCIVLKLKSENRLLCADMASINEIMNVPAIMVERNSSSLVRTLEDDLSMRVPQSDSTPRSVDDGESTCSEIEEIATVQELRDYISERIIEFRVKAFLKKLVERHVRIIRYVKLSDKTFMAPTALSIELGTIIVALFLGKINLNEPLTTENVLHAIEIPEILGCIGLFNYVGQIMLDESEFLRQALYNCDWTDKPRSLRRGLLIMQTVAARPLRLTVGGTYTLGMETYGNVLRATYSYTSIVQSLGKNSSPATPAQ